MTIVADNDEPGVKGAELLAKQLTFAPDQPSAIRLPVRILVVPHPYKDVRDWYLAGKLTAKVFTDLVSAQQWR